MERVENQFSLKLLELNDEMKNNLFDCFCIQKNPKLVESELKVTINEIEESIPIVNLSGEYYLNTLYMMLNFKKFS
jgi:hypothetical protein